MKVRKIVAGLVMSFTVSAVGSQLASAEYPSAQPEQKPGATMEKPASPSEMKPADPEVKPMEPKSPKASTMKKSAKTTKSTVIKKTQSAPTEKK